MCVVVIVNLLTCRKKQVWSITHMTNQTHDFHQIEYTKNNFFITTVLKQENNYWIMWIVLTFQSRIIKKKIKFDLNNNIFDIDNIELSDSNCQVEKSNSTDQKYQKTAEILWISKIIKSKTAFMRTLFKSVYVKKKNSNEIHLSKKFKLWEMLSKTKKKNSVMHINTAYKWKMNKIQSINLEKMMRKKSNELINW
jgi:hypothetical protein